MLRPFYISFLRKLEARDREIISDVGFATDLKDVKAILRMLPSYYGDEWKFRKRFGFRLSSRRVLAHVRAVLPGSSDLRSGQKKRPGP